MRAAKNRMTNEVHKISVEVRDDMEEKFSAGIDSTIGQKITEIEEKKEEIVKKIESDSELAKRAVELDREILQFIEELSLAEA